MLDESGHVRAQEVFAIAQTDNQRRVATSGKHNIWLVFVNNQDGERTVQTLDHVGECGWQVAGGFELASD